LGPPEKAGYEHQSIVLAEGFEELGIQTLCNVNLWQKTINENDFLIKKVEDTSIYKDCDVVIFSSNIYSYQKQDLLPKELFTKVRNYKLVFIDSSDGLITPGLNVEIQENVDIVLKSHYTKANSFPGNFKPWQFGISNRIINAVKPFPFLTREKKIMVNFRVKHNLRDVVQKEILPIIEEKFALDTTTDSLNDVENISATDLLYWEQTGRRHYPTYYNRLARNMACASFGGELIKVYNHNNSNYSVNILNELRKIISGKRYSIYQFDSWRFWEALVAGCCTFHVDFNKFGFVLPVNPVNQKHYFGSDIFNPFQTKKFMKHDYSYFEDISSSGREWVLDNYSPKKVAERFLKFFY